MIKYVDLTPEYGIPEYSADLFDEKHASLLELGGERVESITAEQIIEQSIGKISVRSKNSLATLIMPGRVDTLAFEYEYNLWKEGLLAGTASHVAVPAYADMATVKDFVADEMEERSWYGRKKVINRVFPEDYHEGKIGHLHSIAFTEASVGSPFQPIHLLTAMEGPNFSRNPGMYPAFYISKVLDIIVS